jgi:hypothetical protein
MIMRVRGWCRDAMRGEAIRLHEGLTAQQLVYEQEKVQADGLAGRICAAAADAARSQYVLLELLGEFDASMTPGWLGNMSGSPRRAAHAEDHPPVSGGPVVVFEGAGGHPGGRRGR